MEIVDRSPVAGRDQPGRLPPRLRRVVVFLVLIATPEEVARAEFVGECAPAVLAIHQGIELPRWLFPREAVAMNVADVAEHHLAPMEQQRMIVSRRAREAFRYRNPADRPRHAVEFRALG